MDLNKKLGVGIATIAMAATLGLAGCGSSDTSSTTTDTSTSTAAATTDTSSSAASPEVGSGFEETPIFEDVEAGGWLNVSAVYFQPVPMTDGSTIEGKDIHLEADIHAKDNNFGFGVGEWVPYMNVSYTITKEDGSVEAEGTFMEMNASDGPHYGANIAMPDGQGTYTITITMGSPADNNFLLHTDSETGPGAQSFDDLPDGSSWPLEVTETWDYVPLEY